MFTIGAAEILRPIVISQNRGKPLFEAAGLGVRYRLGGGREDVQSLTYNALVRRQDRGFWALKDINLVGHTGEVLGVIGANGTGKTTL
jgi:ABC-type polysaccharide/polyol phosphate transport system ATPase subunit